MGECSFARSLEGCSWSRNALVVLGRVAGPGTTAAIPGFGSLGKESREERIGALLRAGVGYVQVGHHHCHLNRTMTGLVMSS